MSFPFHRIFRLLLSQQSPGDAQSDTVSADMSAVKEAQAVSPTTTPSSVNQVEPSAPAVEIAEERPFHVFEAPLSGDGALIFVLPPNQPEGDDDKRSRCHLRRQRAKAREMSRREARRAKQSWQFAAAL